MNWQSISVSAFALALAACATVPAPSKELARADIANPTGKRIGTATISERDGTVTLTIQAKGLTPGAHGAHLHMTGKCEGPAFASAGGHLNPAMHQHGVQNPAGSHLGDLPNLVAARDGAGVATIMFPGAWSALESQIFDADGTAIVLHAGADDYKTDPSGNSGGRVACGTFTRG
ncbi:superoxide dismutase family protein [Novosphingobium sp. KCTC 2891]|uniref:superoxide dismutase family protein n=1 Tax=Novosphingobium sp. KCTC 2891 TaxID=2989730 RepID=UPI00222149D6|nr:superoxide dismutase family protein [Novosphingobium sp. KCTC 2891]MCW1383223.1 superoxide dismutase family protein [Novosphingobium sp. KCTC 2891]